MCAVKGDREGGKQLDISLLKLDINGFIAKQGHDEHKFIAPCVYYGPFGVQSYLDNYESKVIIFFFFLNFLYNIIV